MAYNEAAAARVRAILSGTPDVDELRMMGALAFTRRGHMCCGVTGSDLMVRVGPHDYEAALREPHVAPFEMGGGRRPRAFVCVAPKGYASDAALAGWVDRGIAFVATLPDKPAKA